MFISTHALLGIVISQHVDNVPAAFGLGVISHYLLDMIPHGDEKIGQWMKKRPLRGFLIALVAEVTLISVFIITVYIKKALPRPGVVMAGLLGGTLPDLIWYSYDFYRGFILKHFPKSKKIIQDVFRLESFFEHHNQIHKWFHDFIKTKINLVAGVFIQAVIVFGLLLLSVKKP
jgi:hypothetical protein